MWRLLLSYDAMYCVKCSMALTLEAAIHVENSMKEVSESVD